MNQYFTISDETALGCLKKKKMNCTCTKQFTFNHTSRHNLKIYIETDVH